MYETYLWAPAMNPCVRRRRSFLLFVTASQLTLLAAAPLFADGRLLRGEKWEKFVPEGKQADFYVSLQGRDTWSGTLPAPNVEKTDGPFASIGRAQIAVRALKKTVYRAKKPPIERRYIGSSHELGDGRDILVFVRGGYYALEEPLLFAPEDGGERCETDLPSGAFEYHKLKDFYVTYAAYPGESPRLTGGSGITSWRKENGIWSTTVKDISVKDLVAGGKRQRLARTPNEGYFTLAEIPQSTQAFKFHDGELEEWPGMEENRIVLLLRWHIGVNAIASIDPSRRIAHLRTPEKGIVVVPPRYYVENVLALLDAPGEWFFERPTGKLSYLPDQGIEDPRQAMIVVPALSKLVVVRGERGRPVRNLRFYGLTLEATQAGGHVSSFAYAHGCELVDSRIRGVGGSAVHLGVGCYQTRIVGNTILGAEEGGILVDGQPHPENWQDTIRETSLTHNSIEDCGGISIRARNSLNTTISHNEVTRNRGRTAISVGGWRNVEEAIDGGYRVEFNHVHHVQAEADDSGAITTAGLTYDSVVRGNLIHDVRASFFNENVAIWFDNMSSGWLAENNISYNLEQGEMKLCASNLVDNVYQDNYLIEAPESPPEGIIDGEPMFQFGTLEVRGPEGKSCKDLRAGDVVRVSAVVSNRGATGIGIVRLFVDGKTERARKFPAVRGNASEISFETRLCEPGVHRISIGATSPREVTVRGEPFAVVCDSLELSAPVIPAGGEIDVSSVVESFGSEAREAMIDLLLDDQVVASKAVRLVAQESRVVQFALRPERGAHTVRVGNSPPARLEVYPHEAIDISRADFRQYCSATAKPCEFNVVRQENRFRIEAAGTDFFHGEDSYGATYLKGAAKGNFVATVKIVRFDPRTHEWFRAGLFVRNDMTKSYDPGNGSGSRGSVLLFATPCRVGMGWDAYGDGRMERARSRNHPTMEPYPMWLKLVRHGDSFSGYISYDGEANWVPAYQTARIPGLATVLDIGLAAGGPDQRPYGVELADLTLTVENLGWR